MTRGRHFWIVTCFAAAVSGCAGGGPLTSQRTTVGTLKASVSHLEFENQQLKRQVADLKAETREVENRLVQEESVNGELSARLDDARALLSRRGLGDSATETVDGSPVQQRNTLPAGRSNRKPRKPPFARIPGLIDAAPAPSNSDEDDAFAPSRSPGFRDDLHPQGRLERPSEWLPVVTGITDPMEKRR